MVLRSRVEIVGVWIGGVAGWVSGVLCCGIAACGGFGDVAVSGIFAASISFRPDINVLRMMAPWTATVYAEIVGFVARYVVLVGAAGLRGCWGCGVSRATDGGAGGAGGIAGGAVASSFCSRALSFVSVVGAFCSLGADRMLSTTL